MNLIGHFFWLVHRVHDHIPLDFRVITTTLCITTECGRDFED